MPLSRRPSLPPPADAADRIVLATIACIEETGIDGLTVRAIARAAGVNVAAINYYFGTKDHLVAVVLERTLDRGVRDPIFDFDALVAAGKDARTALLLVVDALVGEAVARPRAAFAHLHGPIVEQDYRRDAVVRTNALLEALFRRLRAKLAGKGTRAKRCALAQMWSAVLMASLAPRLLQAFAGVDLADARQRRAWASALVDGALSEAASKPRRMPRARPRRPKKSRGATRRR